MRLNDQNREEMKSRFELLLRRSKHQWGKNLDQVMLSKYLFPKLGTDYVEHDSYLCGKYSDMAFHRPYPTKRDASDDFLTGVKFNFVGSNGGNLSLTENGPCPEKCRPKDHIDWIIC